MGTNKKEIFSITLSPLVPLLFFMALLVLKLGQWTEVANWSWWWVTSPLWIPLLAALVCIILWFIVYTIVYLIY